MPQRYTEKELQETLGALKYVERDNRFGDDLDVYAYDNQPFLVHFKDSQPVKVTLRCDTLLGRSLQQQYESVLQAKKLDPREWITILATEQLPESFMYDLIVHAYVQVGGEL